MGREHKLWAKRARARLVERLGGACALCGTTDNLVFDCIIPQGDKHHRMDPSARMCFYHRQERLGNVQVLCDACNTAKAAKEQPYCTFPQDAPENGEAQYA